MKILFVVHGLPPGQTAGTEVYTQTLARFLSQAHDVIVLYRCADFSRPEYELRYSSDGRVRLISINNTFRAYRSFADTYCNAALEQAFARILDEVRPDIVHIQHLLYLSAGFVAEAKKKRIPVIVTLHDYWLRCPQGQLFRNNQDRCQGEITDACRQCVLYQLGIRKNVSRLYSLIRRAVPEPVFRLAMDGYLSAARHVVADKNRSLHFLQDRWRYMQEVCAQVDLFIAPSHWMKKKFISFGVRPEVIVQMPYGFDTLPFRCITKMPSPAVRFGFIGNLMQSKGLHVLLESFRGIAAETACLLIFGRAFSYKSALGGYVRRIESMIRQDNIRLMGGFDHDRPQDAFGNIDVLVVPSLWDENAPLVIPEAFLAHIPVIASHIGGIPELVSDGANGLLCEAGNAADLRKKIVWLIENPGQCRVLASRAAAVVDIADHAAGLLSCYRRLGPE